MVAADDADGEERKYFRNGRLSSGPATTSAACDRPPETGSPSVAASDRDCAAEIAAAVALADGRCIRLFIAGSVTHVGKTTVCLGILAALRQAGVLAKELAYIKPATQCEAPDLLKKWCQQQGIEYVSGQDAPMVFYPGFTRSFLSGEQGTSSQWLEKIADRVGQLSQGRKVVVVDGVGFPAVGSIVGVDNADVAAASRAPVVVVCRCGVGAAVDSFNLNSSYFLSRGVPVLGGLFNMGEPEGFYAWDKCAGVLRQWFEQKAGRRERYYGVVPIAPELVDAREWISETADAKLEDLARVNAMHLARHADLAGMLVDATLDVWCRAGQPPPAKRMRSAEHAGQPMAQQQPHSAAAHASGSLPAPKSRDAVATDARKRGAAAGG